MISGRGQCAGAVPANLREGRSGAQRSGGPHEDAGTARVLTLQELTLLQPEPTKT